MVKKKITIESNASTMKFLIEEHEDHIVLVRYLTNDLEVVLIPNEIEGKLVTEIGSSCFFDHPEIKSVVFPDHLKAIGDNSFALCKGIHSLTLPDNVTDIGTYAFRDCQGLRSITTPSSLKVLRTGVFAYCCLPEDVEINLKEGLEVIESRIFTSGGVNLFFTLKIPASVTTIADDAFEPGMTIILACETTN